MQLPDSSEMVRKRIERQKKRLHGNLDLKRKYTEQMNSVIDSGYAEIVPKEQVCRKDKIWYISHHPVFNAKNPTNFEWFMIVPQWRKPHNLKDFLMERSDLTNSQVAVLLRFQKHLCLSQQT